MKLFRRCKHNCIKIHSLRFGNMVEGSSITHAVGICQDCGRSKEIKLGFVADSKSAGHRITSDVMMARGYTLKGDLYVRPAKK